MAFKSEEDLEVWFATEKERLSEEFTANIDKDKTNIPKYKEKFNAQIKKLLEKYNAEYEKFLEQMKKMPKKQE
jgi:flagellar capping protein FliD